MVSSDVRRSSFDMLAVREVDVGMRYSEVGQDLVCEVVLI